jgi:hypothetical protein
MCMVLVAILTCILAGDIQRGVGQAGYWRRFCGRPLILASDSI